MGATASTGGGRRPRSSARIGRNFETELVQWLNNRGYYAIKSAGSKGVADVVAFPVMINKPIIIIQAKTGNQQLSLREWDGLLTLAQQSNGCCVPLAAFRQNSKPVFYQLLGPKKPRTRTEDLPWRTYLP